MSPKLEVRGENNCLVATHKVKGWIDLLPDGSIDAGDALVSTVVYGLDHTLGYRLTILPDERGKVYIHGQEVEVIQL